MHFSFNTDLVLDILVKLWEARLQSLPEYLQATFEFQAIRPLEISRLFITQMEDGDVAGNNIGEAYSLEWILEGGTVQAVPLNFVYNDMFDTNTTGDMYIMPSYLFCYQDDAVLLSERYGPCLKHRLRGQLVSFGQQPSVEWRTLWRSGRL